MTVKLLSPPPVPLKVHESVTRTLIPTTSSKERVTKFFFTPSQCWIYEYTAPSTLRMNWGEKFLSTVF